MENVASAVKDTISISLLNRGMAGKIFKMVKDTGPKVVMKNNMPECVLMSPEEYIKLIDEIEDMKMAAIAEERLAHADLEHTYSRKDVCKELGISEEDIKNAGEVEIE